MVVAVIGDAQLLAQILCGGLVNVGNSNEFSIGNAGDEIVGMQLEKQGDSLLIVSEKGMGKRTSVEEFTIQRRGGKGVKCYKINEKTGNVVGVKAVTDESEIMMITTEGVIIQFEVKDISVIGRNT